MSSATMAPNKEQVLTAVEVQARIGCLTVVYGDKPQIDIGSVDLRNMAAGTALLTGTGDISLDGFHSQTLELNSSSKVTRLAF